MAAAVAACSGGGGGTPGDGDGTSSSGDVGASSGNASSSSSGSGGGSSGQQTSSSGGGSSSSGSPIDPGKPGAACDAPSECDDKVCVEHTCRAATATDAVKNGNETGVDCGGSGTGTNTGAPGCAPDSACNVATDCLDKSCNGTVCLAPTSSDTIQNGNETGVDCGASGVGIDTHASKCADTITCGVANDCTSGVCNVTCQVPTNQDSVKNGNETGVDCGSGPTGVDTDAAACPPLQGCLADTDCDSLVCLDLICQAPTCIDSKKNGNETGINCGGDVCAPCGDNLGCLLPRDCTSGVCGADNLCKVPTSTDGVKNGNETGLDCGNSNVGTDTSARACKDTEVCNDDGDCNSGKCTGNTCRVPTKTDGVKNGRETDVDCGSGGTVVNDPYYGVTTDTAAAACADLKACVGVADCTSGVCTGSTCRVPTYTDNVKNGNETDLDCGGEKAAGAPPAAPGARGDTVQAQTNRCVADKACIIDEDCKSDACSGGKCLLARSCAMHHGGDTCGTGDETWPVSATEPAPNATAKKHESCCESIVVNRPAGQGGAYRLDKYQITAGRMRRFLETLANGTNLDGVNVKAWVDAVARGGNNKVMDVNQLPVAHDGFYPTGWNTPVGASNCGQDGTTPCNYGWLGHLGGFRYTTEPGGLGGYGCQIAPTGYGSRTFYLPDAVTGAANKYRAFNGESQHLVSKDRLDQKALTCVDYVMLAAFCAWDGGRLELKPEHAYAYDSGDGRKWPWGPELPMGFTGDTTGQPSGANYTPGAPPNPSADQITRFLRANVSWNYANMIVQDRYYFLPTFRAERANLEPTDSAQDQSFAVAPPGRYPLGAGPFGHRDLSGNMMEITASGAYQWSKNGSFEAYTHTDATNGGYDGYQFSAVAKYGRATGRCVRPLDGYSTQRIPKR